ncbi:MAG TPA: PilZ domain-containing protein [Sphingomicrobium sp.]|nr:PilZ domain-containing protein [Sphingomicrobium sp.]
MDESSNLTSRRSRRAPVLLTAAIEADGARFQVKLRNLSEEGALIESDSLPSEGSAVVFERGELRLKGRLVWVEGRYAGVAFNQPIKAEQVLRNIPQAKSKLKPEFRRPGLVCRPLSAYERRMLERWMTASPMGELGE